MSPELTCLGKHNIPTEESDWFPFNGFVDFESLDMLLHYVYYVLDPYDYTKAHPELLVLGK